MNVPNTRPTVHWSLAFRAATLLLLLVTAHSYLSFKFAPDASEWRNQLFRTITGWYLWAALFPFIFSIARKWRFAAEQRLRSFFIHLSAGAILSFLHAILQVFIADWLFHPERDWNAIQSLIEIQIRTGLLWRFFVYQALVCFSIAFDSHRKAKEIELVATQMENSILQAELDSLKTQLDPDFLFQSLKQLSILMRRNLDEAESLIAKLGTYLRMRLDHSRTPDSKISLDESIQIPASSTVNFSDSHLLQNPVRKWLIITGVLTALGIYFTVQRLLIHSSRGTTLDWPQHLLDCSGWYIWALITPLVLKLSARYPLGKEAGIRSAAVHFIGFVASWVSATVAMEGVKWASNLGDYEFWGLLPMSLARSPLSLDILCYSTILAIESGIRYRKRFEFGRIRAARLSGQLTRARLQALKMQLHPHFLFNSLNSLSELMREDPTAAEKMIRNLEMFLKLTVTQTNVQEIPFEKELEFLQCYLAIENVRYQERLHVTMNIEPQAMFVPVPTLLLQPIVENAIRHGIASRSSPGEIEIHAKQHDGVLELSVRDNGPGIRKSKRTASRSGVGLANTRERLKELYGNRHRFDLINAPEGGLIVNVEIPLTNRIVSAS